MMVLLVQTRGPGSSAFLTETFLTETLPVSVELVEIKVAHLNFHNSNYANFLKNSFLPLIIPHHLGSSDFKDTKNLGGPNIGFPSRAIGTIMVIS